MVLVLQKETKSFEEKIKLFGIVLVCPMPPKDGIISYRTDKKIDEIPIRGHLFLIPWFILSLHTGLLFQNLPPKPYRGKIHKR